MTNSTQSTKRDFVMLLALATFFLPMYASDVKLEELVAKHLETLGTVEARTAIKSRVVQGKLTFKILVGRGSGATGQGTWGLVSEQQKSNFVMRFSYGDYHGEQFVFDGNKTYIAPETSSQQYSRLGGFVHSQDYFLKEGLLGGVLSTGWALESLDKNHPKLIYAGLKKVDNQQVHDLEYLSKRSSDMQIHLYFAPDTYHHVKTRYFMSVAPNMGQSVIESVKQNQIRYTIEERFADFKTVNGVTLPSSYSIEFSQELQDGTTNVYRWDMTVERTSDNIGLDPRNFDTK